MTEVMGFKLSPQQEDMVRIVLSEKYDGMRLLVIAPRLNQRSFLRKLETLCRQGMNTQKATTPSMTGGKQSSTRTQ